MAIRSSSAEPAPPDGVSISEQLVESRIWRVQLDLASGGVRSLLWRGAVTRELADPEAEPHLFQALVRPAPGAFTLSRFIRSRVRFNEYGALLAVESHLDGGTWRTEYSVDRHKPQLMIRAGWSGSPPVLVPEVALPFIPSPAWTAVGESNCLVETAGCRLRIEAGQAVWHVERRTVSPAGPGSLVLRLTGE